MIVTIKIKYFNVNAIKLIEGEIMQELYDMIFSLPPKSFTLVSVIIGFILIDDLDGAEQNALGNFIIMIGQVLETNSGQQQLISSRTSDQNNNKLEKEIEKLKQEIMELQKHLDLRK